MIERPVSSCSSIRETVCLPSMLGRALEEFMIRSAWKYFLSFANLFNLILGSLADLRHIQQLAFWRKVTFDRKPTERNTRRQTDAQNFLVISTADHIYIFLCWNLVDLRCCVIFTLLWEFVLFLSLVYAYRDSLRAPPWRVVFFFKSMIASLSFYLKERKK